MTQKVDNRLVQNINELVGAGEIDKAVKILDGQIATEPTARAYYLRGRLLWKLGRQTDAMSDYSAAVAIDPESEAAAALEMARDVMNFFNPDLYNP